MNKYSRTYNDLKKEYPVQPIQLEYIRKESVIWTIILASLIGVIGAILFLHVHNGNKVTEQQYQQLTTDHAQQVMIQNAGQGYLIQ